MPLLKFTSSSGLLRSVTRVVATRLAPNISILSRLSQSTGLPFSTEVASVDRNNALMKEYVCDTRDFTQLGSKDRTTIVETLRKLATLASAIKTASEKHCISETLWAQSLSILKKEYNTRASAMYADDLSAFHAFVQRCAAARAGHASLASTVDELMPKIVQIAEENFAEQLQVFRERRQGADLRQPHTWYPLARSMKRRIIFHAGPTNSGKTYNALQALKNAWSGVYCGPLRLLALEVFESVNLEGVYCSLLTGQERRELPFARHASCTVEMLSVDTAVDVAVIDEIQMIGDDGRGASWTRAVLGVPASEVHLCGDPAAEPVVRALCAVTGDDLEVVCYARLTAITPLKESLENDYSKIEEGDAVVAFSRKDIYSIRRTIERKTNHKCCVVYGSLPPETRSAQARLFNDPNSGYRVLVASDAIGMGLNLNIRRIVFHTMNKFNGQSTGPIPPAQVKQIAGRAGRRSSIYPEGFATALVEGDVPYLHACMGAPTPPITAAGLFPNAEQLAAFAALLPRGTPLPTIIREFTSASQLDGPYFMCRSDDVAATAQLLETYRASLSLEQRAALCLVPVNLRNIDVRNFFMSFLDQYTRGQPVRLRLQLPINDPSYLVHDLESLEVKASALDTYLWLAARLSKAGTAFPDVDEAVRKRSAVSDMLEQALAQLTEDTKEAMAWATRKQQWAQAAKDRNRDGVGRTRSGGHHEARGARKQHSEPFVKQQGAIGRAMAPSSHSQSKPTPLGAEDSAQDEATTAHGRKGHSKADAAPSTSNGKVSHVRPRIQGARKVVLQRTEDAARAGVSERTVQRLQAELRRHRSKEEGKQHRQAHTKGKHADPASLVQSVVVSDSTRMASHVLTAQAGSQVPVPADVMSASP